MVIALNWAAYTCLIVETICTYTYVRWASEPSAIVQYFGVVGEVNITVVVAADGVMLTGFDYRRITHSQQTVFTYEQQQQRDWRWLCL